MIKARSTTTLALTDRQLAIAIDAVRAWRGEQPSDGFWDDAAILERRLAIRFRGGRNHEEAVAHARTLLGLGATPRQGDGKPVVRLVESLEEPER